MQRDIEAIETKRTTSTFRVGNMSQDSKAHLKNNIYYGFYCGSCKSDWTSNNLGEPESACLSCGAAGVPEEHECGGLF